MYFKSFSFTHPGHVRKVNEDAFYSSDEKGLWIVCDGMGGHDEGNFASHLITDIFEDFELKGDFEDRIALMNKQLKVIHALLQSKVEKLGSNVQIGTTLMLLHISDGKGVCIHSGDTRCYNLRNNILSTVTKDHAVEIDDFYGYRRVLTSAISAPGDLKIEITRFIVHPEDVYLLCSDGLYDNISNQTIKTSMEDLSLKAGIDKLRFNVLSSVADDNITAILIGKK
jgi:serine/threonine protein phosphatase PrpC